MSNSILIQSFSDELRLKCPDTAYILERSRILVHPAVSRIVLEGSRGPGGVFRSDSDIDLSLVVDTAEIARIAEPGPFLQTILETTLNGSVCPVELDIAAVYDSRNCGLVCLDATDYGSLSCSQETTGCMTAYKIQKGFNGFVPPIIEIRKIFPFLTIWSKK